MKIKHLLLLMLSLFVVEVLAARTAPLALIYKGEGSCKGDEKSTGCSEASAAVAQEAGYQVRFVGPQENLDEATWQQAQIWIQPGGLVRDQVAAMSPALLEKIKSRVSQGMGYVGFCAGAFLAAQDFGWIDYHSRGLGLLPLYAYYNSDYDDELTDEMQAKILKTVWDGQPRNVYWEIGPYFKLSDTQKNPSLQVMASYPASATSIAGHSTKVMSLRTTYGRGRVYVTGVHPEAPQDWRDYYHLNDQDGLDTHLAVDMIKWVQPQ